MQQLRRIIKLNLALFLAIFFSGVAPASQAFALTNDLSATPATSFEAEPVAGSTSEAPAAAQVLPEASQTGAETMQLNATQNATGGQTLLPLQSDVHAGGAQSQSPTEPPALPAQLSQANDTNSASSQPPHKSYVCKYVGTPGLNERLQTGQNPIWVDNHSLLGYDGTVTVGQQFRDGQGRSIVVVANTHQLDPEPGLDSCPPPQGPPETVVPAAPTMNDVCDTKNDTYTIPVTTGVTYYVNDETVTAGTHHTNGAASIVVTASANEGYTLADVATSEWIFNFTNEPCAVDTPVVPAAPTATNPCDVRNDTYAIPATTGVTYHVGGNAVAAGTYFSGGAASVVVTAQANEGYALAEGAPSTWTLTFTNEACPVLPGTTTTSSGGQGQVLGATTVVQRITTQPVLGAQSGSMEDTGQNALLPTIASAIMLAAALGTVTTRQRREVFRAVGSTRRYFVSTVHSGFCYLDNLAMALRAQAAAKVSAGQKFMAWLKEQLTQPFISPLAA